jgi:L,D-peptidoglycan transpeptidase YkuD (ErfK/YbiS/YcfS/YnhG family)
MWLMFALAVLVCAATVMVAPNPARADVVTSPSFPASTQMITVTSEAIEDTTATLTAWERDESGTWVSVIGPTEAYLGAEGLGVPRDNIWRTPMGTFALDQAFGNQPDPGTKMPYFQADDQDWWDALPGSPTYNSHVRQPENPGGDSEHILSTGEIYDYVVNIAHNPQRVNGYAAGIFLHVSNDEPTWGCVAIDRDVMREIVQWLDPARQPVISIGLA